MSKINWGRLFLGGLAGGAVVLAGDALVAVAIPALIRSGIVPPPHLSPPTLASALTYVVAVLLVGGPAALWLYVAIRPRFGPGPKTAAYAGLWSWLILGPYLQATQSAIGFPAVFSLGTWVPLDVVALPLIVVAMLAGAAIYKEEDAGAATAAAAGR
ncbi:MAG TPA: hypothetical protein VGT03_07115 [Candidatus Acidoferrales bacterium]|nr:hypothetical protein [Candidatus Acidoferrales bacterium]